MVKLISVCIVIATLATSIPAAAQTSAPPPPTVRGTPTVYVTDTSGRETRGKLIKWDAAAIVLQTGSTTRTFAPGEAVRVDLRGDSLKNGAIFGAVVGAAVGAFMFGFSDCPGFHQSCPGFRVGVIVGSTGIYSAIGMATDAMIPGRTPLWQAAPSRSARNGFSIRVSPERRGASLGWTIR